MQDLKTERFTKKNMPPSDPHPSPFIGLSPSGKLFKAKDDKVHHNPTAVNRRSELKFQMLILIPSVSRTMLKV